MIDSSGWIEFFAEGPHAADSMMLPFARENGAALLTTDSGFEGIAGVTVFSKKTKS